VVKRPQHRLQEPIGRGAEAMDAYDADGLLTEMAGLSQGRGELLHSWLDSLEEPLTRLRQRYAAGVPMQQPDTNTLLQGTYQLAQGGGRYAELLRGTGEIQRFGDRYEGAELAEIAAREHGVQRAHE